MSYSVFTYQPLQNSSSGTRLLNLLPGKFEDEIRCTLRHVDITAKPEYEALSYVWGNPEVTLPIRLAYDEGDPTGPGLLDDAISTTPEDACQFYEFQVTTNLESALRHLRHHTGNRTMWIDAICINQIDVPEREQLVQRMGSIYKNASRVAVWLGDCDGEGEDEASGGEDIEGEASYGGNQGDNNQSVSTTSLPHVQEGSSEEAIMRAFEYIRLLDRQFKSSGRRWHSAPIDTMSVQALEHALPGLKSVSQRRWFTRVWVLQEICLNPSGADIHCGFESVNWDHFWEALCFWSEIGLSGRISSNGFSFSRAHQFSVMYHDAVDNFSSSAEDTAADRLMLAVLHTSGELHCSDPRDKLYGLLGLISCNSPEIPILRPNYSQPLLEFFMNLARFLIEGSGSLALLTAAPGDNHVLPSWIPTWHRSTIPPFTSSPTLKSLTVFKFSDCGQQLLIKAINLGSIIFSKPTNFEADLMTIERLLNLAEQLDTDSQLRSSYVNGKDALMKLLLVFTDREDIKELFEIFVHGTAWPGDMRIPGNSKKEDEKRFLGVVKYWFQERGIVITNQLNVGIFIKDGEPSIPQCEDIVVYVPSCRWPLILRKQNNGYCVVANADVIGYNHDEVEEHIKALQCSRPDEWMEFTLV